MLRQQTRSPRPRRTAASPTTSRRPATTSAASRSPSTAPRSWPPATRPSTTTTGPSWSRRWPTGSPRRSPSTSTCRPAATGSSPTPSPALEDLHAERFRGIRPALGYPASPDHSREAGAVRPARRGAARHGPDRVVRDDPGRQRQRPDLRPPGLALLHRRPHRPRPGRGLRRPARPAIWPRSSAGCAPTSPTTPPEVVRSVPGGGEEGVGAGDDGWGTARRRG